MKDPRIIATTMAKLFLILMSCFGVVTASIPDYIQVCKRSDPKIETCIKNSILNLRPKLALGIPELNVPAIEPLMIPSLRLQNNLNVNFTDMRIQGPSKFEILDLKADLEKNRFVSLMKLPELKFNAKYDIDMNVLRIPLKSSGPMHGYFKNTQVTAKMQGKKTQINGKTHMVFRPIELKIYQGTDRHIQLEKLFRDQKAFQDATNELLNENSDLFNNEILPALEKTLGDQFTLIANSLTARYTYDELFPLN